MSRRIPPRRGRRRPDEPRDRRPRASLLRAGTALCGAAVLALALGGLHGPGGTTAAAYTDRGFLNAAYSSSFAIGAVDAAGRVHLTEGDSLSGRFGALDRMVPGSTAELGLDVFNNTRGSEAQATVRVAPEGELAGEYRFSAAVVPSGTAGTRPGTRPPRIRPPAGACSSGTRPIPRAASPRRRSPPVRRCACRPARGPLAGGDPWTGPAASRARVVLYAHLLDNDRTSAVSTAATRLTLTLEGTSS
ncbi:hypothetical protein NBM05_14090 [Rothia sp. AR01]|uniref:Uncharacterized protein n=1 Tax=Rothia santali TaxID=2949643 RepID=A0A9X2HF01_9MICC|nr:hypothetical protein [Rothia santali]MCP3427110.1 hypothetical protein [Rothia santali]